MLFSVAQSKFRPARMTIPIRLVTRRSGKRLEDYQLFLLASLGLGIGVGFLLALLMPLSRWLGWGFEGARPDLAQVHGQVQMLGFVGLFVMGMALRLMPRFSHAELRFQQLAVPLLLVMATALLVRALVVIWLPLSAHAAAVAAVQVALLAGVCCFAVIVWATLLRSAARQDPTTWFFLAGSLILLLASLLGVFAALEEIGAQRRLLPYLADTALTFLLLAGFTVAFIGGVSGRAIPTLVGLDRALRAGRGVAVGLTTAVSALAAALLYLEYVDYGAGAVRIAGLAFIGLGLASGAIVWLSGIYRPAANRVRSASQPHMWLVRSAFAWLTFAAVLELYVGARGVLSASLPGALDLDAVRHALGLGLATNLICGMSLLILPEFAGERMHYPRQAGRSYLLLGLLNTSAALRVIPALVGAGVDNDLRSALQALAGGLAEVALAIFAWSLVRLVRRET